MFVLRCLNKLFDIVKTDKCREYRSKRKNVKNNIIIYNIYYYIIFQIGTLRACVTPKTPDTKDTAECDFVACTFFCNFALSLREMAAQPAADSMARQATPPATRGDAAGRNTPKAKARRQATHGEAKRQQFQSSQRAQRRQRAQRKYTTSTANA